jgi:hypothetical protein
MGLIAAVWLIVLGLTGFLLDHRDTWRWLWQDSITSIWVNDAVLKKSKAGQIRLYQINPKNAQQHITGGLTGLWWSDNAGKRWIKTKFIGVTKAPMIYSAIFTSKNKLWIASDDGLWLSANGGKSALNIALKEQWVSALSINEKTKIVTGVIDRTEIFNYTIDENRLNFIDLEPVHVQSLPKTITLSRFTRDVHYGRGVFEIHLSLLWNDISAIAMIILPLSGFFFYWLPKRWRRDKKRNKKHSHKYKKQSIRWLFRLHGPTFGLVSVIPFIYLSLTGILLDHGKELRGWMKSIELTRSWQTPVYNLNSWQGEIYGIVKDLDNPEKFSVGTRLGLFTTTDNGQHWQRENLLGDKAHFVWMLRRHNENLFIGGMGGPNMVKAGNQAWKAVKGIGHMPSDITVDDQHNWIWKSRHGLKSTTRKTGISEKDINLPVTNAVPWFYIIDGLHSGVLIHSQWKWINDFIAVLAILLIITGLIRWWRKKWI